MRRLMLVLLLCLMPVLAAAAPDMPYAPETAPRYAMLTEEQQALLDTFHAAATAGQTRVDLPPGTRYDDAAAALELLTLDFPELAGLDHQYVIGYYRHAPSEATYVELRYCADLPELNAMRRAVIIEAEKIVRGAQGGTDVQREKYLHDALCARVTYDPGAPHPHDAYGALAEGRATCEGYAQAMTLLCRMAGVPCTTLTGMAWDGTYMQNHAWNYVCVGDGWYQTDATFDDQQNTVYWYFNLTGSQMGVDHQWEYLPMLPAGDGRMEYHALTGQTAASLAQAEEILLRNWHTGSVSLRFTDAAAYEAFIAEPGEVLRRVNSCADTPHTGGYSLLTGGQQLCVLVNTQ